jgi:16S rRNA (guanine966-N2)-methyltransferase
MRIISGKYKGRRVLPPKSLPVRPTTDFAKESLFNLLENKIELDGITVLDLFAGTGNITFEFASRGATQVTSVDQHPACCTYIVKVVQELEMPVKVHRANAFSYLEKLNKTFDIIFADPPYNHPKLTTIPQLVFKNNLLNKGGILVLEHGSGTEPPKTEQFLATRTCGNVNFSFYQANEE